MIDKAESTGLEYGASYAHLDVRETQNVAIKLFESKGYTLWGTNPSYALVSGKTIKGYYYYKDLKWKFFQLLILKITNALGLLEEKIAQVLFLIQTQ